MNKAIQELEEKIALEAIKHINIDEMAKKMAKKIEAEMLKAVDDCLENHLDIGYWITEELQNEKTPIGKAYQKALKGIAAKMVSAI